MVHVTTKHQSRKAVYAGSFDPVTKGHLWIIEQAATMFDHVIIAIGENVEKIFISFKNTLTTAQRSN